ncbi:MAG: GGDEF domain-containing protein [Ruminococcaceae bacterium]|jgi:diguanylate cyclase (GGDEF)-like protein|nr:GGDEF domain-containing protein [Oscillospiraceae bacterium]
MDQKTKKQAVGRRGVSANTIMLPIIAALFALFLAILVLMIHISANGLELSRFMQAASQYEEDATGLLAGSSLLSETANNFVLMPVRQDGKANTGPLTAFAAELKQDRRGGQVLERFRGYEVSEEALQFITAAADSAESMLENQLRAIALVCAVYPLPSEPWLDNIPLPELSEAEKLLTDEEKLAEARLLILNSDYAQNRRDVSQNVTACTDDINAMASEKMEELTLRFRREGILLFIAMTLTVLMLVTNFTVLYRQMILPLTRSVHLIEIDEPLDPDEGLREVRLVSAAYDRLLERRKKLEAILRAAAATDTLTGLPNRYGFEQYLMDAGQSGYSVALFLFDINYLKTTNDTYGHAAGDKLIRSAADCIHACFGAEDDNNCFRFGGDEFAAVVRGCTQESIEEMTRRFEELQKQRGISVSWGCAYAQEIGDTTVKELMDEADRQMYVRKEAMHKDLGESRSASVR